MRNLIRFFVRFHPLFLLIALEIISLTLLIQNNTFHRAAILNSASTVTGHLYAVRDEVTDYLYLKQKSKALAEANDSLMELVDGSFYMKKYHVVNKENPLLKQKYSYIPADVINNSIYQSNNYLTLDKGSLQGVEPLMGVINKDGVIGIVKDVSTHFSTVMTLLHKDIRISAKLKKNNYKGSFRWPGTHPRRGLLEEIPKNIPIEKGDKVVTSGFSTFFPEGIPIGKVISAELEGGNNFYIIEIQLSTTFKNLSYVHIVNHLMKEEQLQLESSTINE